MVAAEDFAVNHVASPTQCPPDYAAIWWDEVVTKDNRKKATKLRFARIPNS